MNHPAEGSDKGQWKPPAEDTSSEAASGSSVKVDPAVAVTGEVPDSEAPNGAGPDSAVEEGQAHFLFGAPEPVRLHLPQRLHIGEGDSDDEITTKLRDQGVRIGRGLIAPRVFWPALRHRGHRGTGHHPA